MEKVFMNMNPCKKTAISTSILEFCTLQMRISVLALAICTEMSLFHSLRKHAFSCLKSCHLVPTSISIFLQRQEKHPFC
jgi:hypothetical protein